MRMKNMEMINEIYALYDAYVEKVEELERNKKITAGLFGLTKGPKDDPCHDLFAQELETKLRAFAGSAPDTEEVRSLLYFIFTVPLKHKDNNMIYWMFAAVHGLTSDLISLLNRSDAEALYQQYNTDYPRWERLPAQKKVLKVLKEKANL